MHAAHLGPGDLMDFVEPPPDGPIVGYRHRAVAEFMQHRGGFSGGKFSVDSNMYTYCGNSPVNRIDASGMAWWEYLPVVSTLGHGAQLNGLPGTSVSDYNYKSCAPHFDECCRRTDQQECKDQREKSCRDCISRQAAIFASQWTGSSIGADFMETGVGLLVSTAGGIAIRQGVAGATAWSGVGVVLAVDGAIDIGILVSGLTNIHSKAREIQGFLCTPS